MDSSWFRWIALNAKYLFWLVWGAGLGAFGAVFFKAVDVGGDALRVYMAILTVMMGGALGLLGSRSLDHYADRRKLRRKINAARFRMMDLAMKWELLLKVLTEVTNEGRIEKFSAPELTLSAVAGIAADVIQIRSAAATPPDFDEIVDTEDDLVRAQRAKLIFDHVAIYFDEEWSMTTSPEKRRMAIANFLNDRPLEVATSAITALNMIARHFAARVADE